MESNEEGIAAMRAAFARQHAASRRDTPPALAERRAWLAALESELRAHADRLAQAVRADFGHRPDAEFGLGELAPVFASIVHARRHLPRWMRPRRQPVPLAFRPGAAWVRWQPLGCVGIVAPWNYPLLLSLSPLVDALAAGNRVLLKPSELTPRFSAALATMLAACFPPDRVAVTRGGPALARAFTALPFDHLLFTGSTALGREVMRAAADNLTPLTLELGGKSPAILCADYPVAEAARRIAAGKFFNAGQTCLAPDYVLAPADRAEAFARAILARARRCYPAIAGNPDYAAIVSARHWDRLHAALAEAGAAGARVLRLEDAPAERRFGPTVVLDPPPDCALMRDEIFGPILPVIGVRGLEEAIGFVNARPRPLAIYPFTHDRGAARAILDRTLSGGASWNGAVLHCAQPALPFGGVGASGFGAYHGEAGFRRFSHARAVYRAGWFSGFAALAPPYGRLMRLMARGIGLGRGNGPA